MRIAVLGGVGFIGTNLALEALGCGHKVVAFDNLSRRGVEDNLKSLQQKKGFEFVWGDVRKRGDFEKLPQVDAMINLAANPSVVNSIKYPRYDFETNAGGTVNSLDYAREHDLKYIYASTNKVYSDITNEFKIEELDKKYRWQEHALAGSEIFYQAIAGVDAHTEKFPRPSGINEDFPISGFGKYGHSLYGISKLAGELYCQEYHIQFGIPMVIFRMSCIYGLHQKGVEEQAWVDHFLRRILKGEVINIFGTGKQVRDVLDGRDTARAYLDALENIDKVDGEIFTLGGGLENTYSLLEAIEVIEKITGKKANLNFKTKRPADQDIYISSISKVKYLLGWEPTITFERGIKDMIEAYKSTS